jgi:hypothetical protein
MIGPKDNRQAAMNNVCNLVSENAHQMMKFATATALSVMDSASMIEEGETINMSNRPSLDEQTLKFFVRPPATNT